MKAYMHFCAYLMCNSLNIFLSKKCLKQKLLRKIIHFLCSICFLQKYYSFQHKQIGYYVCISASLHSTIITVSQSHTKLIASMVFIIYVSFPTFITMDNWVYAVRKWETLISEYLLTGCNTLIFVSHISVNMYSNPITNTQNTQFKLMASNTLQSLILTTGKISCLNPDNQQSLYVTTNIIVLYTVQIYFVYINLQNTCF
jgi:hypothetical protein